MTTREVLQLTFPLWTCVVVLLGACVGSFLNVVVWRLPRGESLVSPPSHCPKCGASIRPWENIPILSWLILRGRCAHCGQPISMRYPLVEAATALLFLGVWLRIWNTGMPLSSLPNGLFLAAALLAITLIDMDHCRIPNKITYPGMLLAGLTALLWPASRVRRFPSTVAAEAVLDFPRHLYAWLPDPLLATARHIALLDVLAGTLVGALALGALLEIGKRIWGFSRHCPPTPASLEIDAESVTLSNTRHTWSEMFARRSDTFAATVSNVRVALNDEAECRCYALDAPAKLTVRKGVLTIAGDRVPVPRLQHVSGMARDWRTPREVMGMGDVKLLAMLGAFLGPEAVLPVLMLSALGGSVTGLIRYIAFRHRHRPYLAYAPFLAAAAMAWFFAGAELAVWYREFLVGLLGISR